MNNSRPLPCTHHSSLFVLLLTLTTLSLLAACQSAVQEQKASVNSLTAPLPTPTPPAADPRRTQPERIGAGSTPPDFTLEDKDGRPYMLSAYRGKKSVVLVFYRGYF